MYPMQISDRIILDERIKVGDRVIVAYDKRGDSYDYKSNVEKALDGKVGTVVFFHLYEDHQSRIRPYRKPGTYMCRGPAWVRFDDGTGAQMSAHDIAWFNMGSDIDERRLEEQRARNKKNENHVGFDDDEFRVYTGPLPELPFWEGDEVEVFNKYGSLDTYFEGRQPKIRLINYHNIGDFCNDKVTPMPIYDVQGEGTGTCCFRESELKLVKRGNLFKHYNGLPLEFADLAEEAAFAQTLGKVHQLRNPISGNYGWTLDQVLDAIREGRAHSIQVSPGFFGSRRSPQAYRFEDEELGKRVAASTLEGFKDHKREEA